MPAPFVRFFVEDAGLVVAAAVVDTWFIRRVAILSKYLNQHLSTPPTNLLARCDRPAVLFVVEGGSFEVVIVAITAIVQT